MVKILKYIDSFLKKLKAGQRINVYVEAHRGKAGTPTMGGLIFIIPTIVSIIILLLWNKIEFSANLFIVLFVFIAYALLGFIDDYLIIKRKNNEGLTEFQKLAGQILIALIFFFIYMKSGAEPIVEVYTLGIEIHLDKLPLQATPH